MYINNKIYHMSLLACMLSVLLISKFLQSGCGGVSS